MAVNRTCDVRFYGSERADRDAKRLLAHHVIGGRAVRVRRGIYRLVHFPAGEHEDLVSAWLWSDLAGCVSHQTALALFELSDALPANIHLTLPAAWRRRRFRVPHDLVLHLADVREKWDEHFRRSH